MSERTLNEEETTMNRAWRVWALALVVAAVGWGGAEPGGAAEPIKVGVLAPMTGTYAYLGVQETTGIKMALDEANERGGVLGRKFEMVIENDEADPTIGVRKITKLLTQDKVDFVIGTVSSGVTLAVAPVAEKYRKVLVVPVAEAANITGDKCSRYVFRASGNSQFQANALGSWMVTNLGKKFYYVGADYALGWSSVKTMKESVQKAGGDSLGEVFAPLGTTDYGAYYPKIQAGNPDVLFVTLAANDAIRFMTQLDTFGLRHKYKIAGGAPLMEIAAVQGMGPKVANGIVSVSRYIYTLDSPRNTAFVTKYKAASKGEVPSQYSESSYAAGYLLVKGIEKAGSVDTDRAIKAFEGIQLDLPRGMVTIRPGDHQALHDKYIIRVKDNGYEIIDKKPAAEVAPEVTCKM